MRKMLLALLGAATLALFGANQSLAASASGSSIAAGLNGIRNFENVRTFCYNKNTGQLPIVTSVVWCATITARRPVPQGHLVSGVPQLNAGRDTDRKPARGLDVPSTLPARADEVIDKVKFAAAHMSPLGTKRTCRDDLLFVRFRREADIRRSRYMPWSDVNDPKRTLAGIAIPQY
jgi:hypothetical protein